MSKAILSVVIILILCVGVFMIFSSVKQVDIENDEIQRSTINFDKSGYLVKDNPGLKPGVWYLVYETAGAPALTAELLFDTNSQCSYNNTKGACPDILFLSSALTRIHGFEVNGIVRVVKALSGN